MAGSLDFPSNPQPNDTTKWALGL